MMVLKAVWGQGHGRERSYGIDDCGASFLRNHALDRLNALDCLASQLSNCPREYALANVKIVILAPTAAE